MSFQRHEEIYAMMNKNNEITGVTVVDSPDNYQVEELQEKDHQLETSDQYIYEASVKGECGGEKGRTIIMEKQEIHPEICRANNCIETHL